MVSCRCTARGCSALPGGSKKVSVLEAQEHRRDDLARIAAEAETAAQKAIDIQEEDLAACVASMTLADRTTGPSTPPQHPPRNNLNGKVVSDTPSGCRTSPDSPSDRVACQLSYPSDIDSTLDSLMALSISHDSSAIAPTASSPLFPLSEALARTSSLEASIRNSPADSATVKETKKLLAEKANTLLGKLLSQRDSWSTKAKTLESLPSGIGGTVPGHSSVYNTEHHFTSVLLHADPLVQLSLFLMATLRVVYHSSRDSCRWVLQMLSILVLTAFQRRGSTTESDEKFFKTFPRDPDTVLNNFHLESKTVIYAVCPNPKCHKLYAPVPRNNDPRHPEYPVSCSYRKFPSSDVCGEIITQPKRVNNINITVPIKRFVYFDFRDWLAGLLSRPGYEDFMDAAWIREAADDCMTDIFDGKFLKEFKGPDGVNHFSIGGSSARYVMSLCVDSFNPYTNKQAGKKASIGMVSGTLLNLPPHLRYRPECIYLAGVIPGPNEPPLDAINHYIEPFIDTLCELWSPGIPLSRTYNHPEGRLVICALVAVVCDLPGARKLSGFAGIGHEFFCSLCTSRRSQNGLSKTDYQSWIPRTNETCREWAQKYLEAETKEDRKAVFDAGGIRWSQLLRLPYFDIGRCVVVDSMHNLFLGLLKEHFQGILGIGADRTKTENPCVFDISLPPPPNTFDSTEKKDLAKLIVLLQSSVSAVLPGTREESLKKLTRFRLRALDHAACNLSIVLPPAANGQPRQLSPGGHYKKPYATAILDWRLQQQEREDAGPSSSCYIMTDKEMKQIREDIRDMITPSWLTSVPLNLGSASHGKLKADQWRVLGTTYLPISLIRLWGNHPPNAADATRRRDMLLVTISLLSAVVLASSRKATVANAQCYTQLMQAYLRGLQIIFPKYKFRPNHHMAMHLHQFIIDFGPPHGWWTFPFERLIGLLQRMPHNGKIGELEATITYAFNRAANLRGLLEKPQCPEIIRSCKALFVKFADPHVRSTLLTDASTFASMFEDPEAVKEGKDVPWDHGAEIPTPTEVSRMLIRERLIPPRRVICPQALLIRGLRYTVPSIHQGNSLVLVKKTNRQPYAAQIQRIISFHTNDIVKTLLIIRPYTPVDDQEDIFSQYPVLGARTWKTQLGDAEVAEPDQVVAHFACLHLNETEMVGIDLSREYLFG